MSRAFRVLLGTFERENQTHLLFYLYLSFFFTMLNSLEMA